MVRSNQSKIVDMYVLWLDSCIRRKNTQVVQGEVIEKMPMGGMMITLLPSPTQKENILRPYTNDKGKIYSAGKGIAHARCTPGDTYVFVAYPEGDGSWEDAMPKLEEKAMDSIVDQKHMVNLSYDEQIKALKTGVLKPYDY